MKTDPKHPRFKSLEIRDRLVTAVKSGIVAPQGLIAHGRGEAFDYMIGEKSLRAAGLATSAAAALLLRASNPVLSVNGNTAALVGQEIVDLANLIPAGLEVNLFHRTLQRERRIARHLKSLGAREILGVGLDASDSVKGIASSRRWVDPKGIGDADVVLVPLEDGDRAEALEKSRKVVIAVDLNPLSRTSQIASVSIVDNIVRAIPSLITTCSKMRRSSSKRLEQLVSGFDNQGNLRMAIDEMRRYLRGWTTN